MTYCDKPDGCIMCDRELCDGNREKHLKGANTMLTLNDWLIRKIFCRVLKKAFYNHFGYDIRIDLKNVNVEYDGEDVVVGITGNARMNKNDVDGLIEELF